MQTHATHQKPRYALIDSLRCLAILLMLIYHFSYDLYKFNILDSETINAFIFIFIARTCLCLFLFCAGYSIALNYQANPDCKPFLRSFSRNWLKVSAGALLVSLTTYVAAPANWIYFGILHCISISALLALIFIRLPYIAIMTGLSIMVAYWGWGYYFPWIHLNHRSLDYIPLFPWSGMVLIGLGCAKFNLHLKIQIPTTVWVYYISKRSLMIYLAHQPILIGLIWSFQQLL